MQLKNSMGLAFVSVLGVTAPAWADLTPREVFEASEQSLKDFGIEYKAQVDEKDGNVTLSDIVMTQTLPNDQGTMTMQMTGMSYVQQDDGSVAVICPADQKLTVENTLPDSEVTKVVFAVDCAQLDMRISGDPDNYSMTFSGPSFGFKLEESGPTDEKLELEEFSVTLTDIDGHSTQATGSGYQVEQEATIDGLSYKMSFGEPGSEGGFSSETTWKGVSLSGNLDMKEAFDTSNAKETLTQLALSGTYSIDSSETVFKGQSPKMEKFAAHFEGKDGKGEFSLSQGDLALSGSAGQSSMVIDEGDGVPLPLPLELSIASTSVNLKMPLLASEDSKDIAFGLELQEAKVPDVLWGLFDPTAKLPRDPLSLAMQFDGKAKLLADLTDPETQKKVDSGEQVLGELEALAINKLSLKAVGAELDGSGDLEFENQVGPSGQPTPVPDGKINLSLSGGEALLENLVAMGLVSQEQAMGAQMMIGMFAKEGSDPDTLTSELEFTADGQIMANGQRIK